MKEMLFVNGVNTGVFAFVTVANLNDGVNLCLMATTLVWTFVKTATAIREYRKGRKK